MHRIILLLLLIFTLPVMAQLKQPDNLLPLPELEEPPSLPTEIEPEFEHDPELEPQITIIKRGSDTIEEHRINGELHMIKVIPRVGLPYYLVKNRGRGLHTHPGDAGIDVSAPMWRLLEF